VRGFERGDNQSLNWVDRARGASPLDPYLQCAGLLSGFARRGRIPATPGRDPAGRASGACRKESPAGTLFWSSTRAEPIGAAYSRISSKPPAPVTSWRANSTASTPVSTSRMDRSVAGSRRAFLAGRCRCRRRLRRSPTRPVGGCRPKLVYGQRIGVQAFLSGFSSTFTGRESPHRMMSGAGTLRSPARPKKVHRDSRLQGGSSCEDQAGRSN
jgi:hypothetical protein